LAKKITITILRRILSGEIDSCQVYELPHLKTKRNAFVTSSENLNERATMNPGKPNPLREEGTKIEKAHKHMHAADQLQVYGCGPSRVL
jgi:hypothetical protein